MTVSDRSPSTSRGARRGTAAALAVAALLGATPSPAQTPAERALAESLFREGKKLLAEGDVAGACRKLEESHRLDAVGGTLLNLATCHEKEGKIATAWAEYQSALELAKQARRRDRELLARRKVDELAPLVPRLTIRLEGAAPEGLVVEVDGVALGEAGLGTGLAVDPGAHTIAARAEGRQPWETTASIATSETKEIVIPALAAIPPPAPPPAPPPPESPAGGWMVPTSYVLGGVSIVALAIGAGFGVAAVSEGDTVAERCPGNVCDAEGLAAHESGRDAATVADVSLILSLVAGAGAVTLFVLAPDDDESPAVAVSAHGGPGAVGGRVRVGF